MPGENSSPRTNSRHGLPVCANLLGRTFHAPAAGWKWVSDITYLRTASGWAYLAVMLDLFDRKVAGRAMSAGMEACHAVIPALEMAVRNRAPQTGLLFHSGRGAQYCSQPFRGRLERLCPQARQSMSRKGNCWDNACAESFFKTLKQELETLDGNHSGAGVRQSVSLYIEAYYNRLRLHSALAYVAPDRFNCGKVS